MCSSCLLDSLLLDSLCWLSLSRHRLQSPPWKQLSLTEAHPPTPHSWDPPPRSIPLCGFVSDSCGFTQFTVSPIYSSFTWQHQLLEVLFHFLIFYFKPGIFISSALDLTQTTPNSRYPYHSSPSPCTTILLNYTTEATAFSPHPNVSLVVFTLWFPHPNITVQSELRDQNEEFRCLRATNRQQNI